MELRRSGRFACIADGSFPPHPVHTVRPLDKEKRAFNRAGRGCRLSAARWPTRSVGSVGGWCSTQLTSDRALTLRLRCASGSAISDSRRLGRPRCPGDFRLVR